MSIKKFEDFKVNESTEDKMFMCYWDQKVFQVENRDLLMCFIDDFSEEQGYSEEEKREIDNLEVTETWTGDHFGKAHIVTRVK